MPAQRRSKSTVSTARASGSKKKAGSAGQLSENPVYMGRLWVSNSPKVQSEESHASAHPGNCDYECCDQSLLLRHRKVEHDYIPSHRRKSGKSAWESSPSAESASLPPGEPAPESSSSLRVLPSSPDFFPIGETSLYLPPIPPTPSLNYQENLFPNSLSPWDGIRFSAEPQMNGGSHDCQPEWFGPADPTPSPSHGHPPFFGYQQIQHNNYTVEFQDSREYSRLTQTFTSFPSTIGNGFMSAPILPTYHLPLLDPSLAFPSPLIDYSSDRPLYHASVTADQLECRWDFGTRDRYRSRLLQ